ncbi:protein TIFY 10A-like [Primulina huaijiensis]|uniref:protein TIFY 10A-like n=1 Tax=Primulina huaijiensis TaxID=1492673 RepID=UPI003CC75C01
MGSPELLDSGKRSNFSQTCSLLSQYLKEGGNFEDVGLVLSTKSEHKGIPTRTMDLLPMIEKSDQSSGATKPDSYPLHGGRTETIKKSDLSGMKSGADQSAQMTIFYVGQVFVFDDFPADKANRIMMLASTAASSPPNTAKRPAELAASFPEFTSARDLCSPHQLLGSDLPIKRKNSLARFLERRKDRIVATEPYGARKPTAAPSKTEAWLELAPRCSSPNVQHH